jgi:hypothetical protein
LGSDFSLVLADGTRHLLSSASKELRKASHRGAVFVGVFRAPGGRIGFDLAEQGEKLFARIIGSAYSWDPRSRTATEYKSGLATTYVRSLLINGLTTPITLASTAKPSDDALAEIENVALTDPDDHPELFVGGIVRFTLLAGRTCVHSTLQWETTILAADGESFVGELESACTAMAVGFDHVAGEHLLPRW